MKKSNLTIAVLSGKGGTGKTLVSVNLAAAAEAAVYLDCDVEEPNGHLFFKPEITSEETVSAKIPLIDLDQCNGCRKCVDFCKFNALAFIKTKPVLFKDICHSCGYSARRKRSAKTKRLLVQSKAACPGRCVCIQAA